MSTNIAIVTSFIDAWNRKDLNAIMEAFTDDAFYHNIPMPEAHGKEEIRAQLTPFLGMAEEIHWETHAIAESDDNKVLTERTDKFKIGGTWISIRVMGVMHLENGKIKVWKDYFDLAEFQRQMPAPPQS